MAERLALAESTSAFPGGRYILVTVHRARGSTGFTGASPFHRWCHQCVGGVHSGGFSSSSTDPGLPGRKRTGFVCSRSSDPAARVSGIHEPITHLLARLDRFRGCPGRSRHPSHPLSCATGRDGMGPIHQGGPRELVGWKSESINNKVSELLEDKEKYDRMKLSGIDTAVTPSVSISNTIHSFLL